MSDFARFDNESARYKNCAAQRRLCQRMVQVSSVLFLPVVVLRRLTGTSATTQPTGQRLSIFAEARSNAAAVVPFIFMG